MDSFLDDNSVVDDGPGLPSRSSSDNSLQNHYQSTVTAAADLEAAIREGAIARSEILARQLAGIKASVSCENLHEPNGPDGDIR